ncbi:PD-(D/E)XK nuclease domain-containing protein [Desulfobacter sp.]
MDIDKTPGKAIAQIRQKGYADKFRESCAEIYLIVVEFNRNQRNILIVRFVVPRTQDVDSLFYPDDILVLDQIPNLIPGFLIIS